MHIGPRASSGSGRSCVRSCICRLFDWRKHRAIKVEQKQRETEENRATETLPSSLIFHEVRTLFQKLSGFPKNGPTHCTRRQPFLPVLHLIPFQQSCAETESQNTQQDHQENSHWLCSQEAPQRNPLERELEMVWVCSSLKLVRRVYVHIYILELWNVGVCPCVRERERDRESIYCQ